MHTEVHDRGLDLAIVRNTNIPGKPRRRKVKIVDEIIESLRQDIVTGRIPDGERLPSEKELSEQFGVSQPTVREAVRALETMGLIEVLHGTGTFVRSQGDYALAAALQTLLQLQQVSIMDVLAIRQVLGRYSIEQAAINATQADLDSISVACSFFDKADSKPDAGIVIAHILGFQKALSAAAHNSLLQSLEGFLLALIQEVQANSLGGKGAQFWRSRAMEFQPHRIAILEGIRSRDPVKARAAMDGYFDAQRERFERDAGLRALNLSNPGLIDVVSDMVRLIKD
jgi:GntR family transcriptional regulator, transcriptional repressor for pyruvate dehydrogenase complex